MDNKIKEANFVSAVIYIHNNEREITPFLEWLDTQLDLNFKKYEIICVDDGSTDQSFKIIKNWQAVHSNIRCVRQQNGGAGSARN